MQAASTRLAPPKGVASPDLAGPVEKTWSFLSIGTICLALFFCLLCTANGQNQGEDPGVPLNEIEGRLTGGGVRTWVFQQEVVTMGGSDDCTQGDVFRFAADHSVIQEVCEKGKLRKDKRSWKFTGEGPLDVALTIGEEKYLVLFKQSGEGWLMRLRKPSDSKTQPTDDKEYRYLPD
jgi:hypothetical protein